MCPNNTLSKNGREVRENTYRLVARNAQDLQRVSVADSPFENVELDLDSTGSRPVSARFSDATPFKPKHRARNSEALETFRGTLIDGVLQPNVRLGNGLRLSNNPDILDSEITETRKKATRRSKDAAPSPEPRRKPLRQLDVHSSRNPPLSQESDRPRLPTRLQSRALPWARDLERREAQIAERERELLQIQQRLLLQTVRNQSSPPRPNQTVRSPPESNTPHEHRTQRLASAHTDDESSVKVADIEARERALQQQEEILRYKRKVWLLEQKLAQATGRPPSRRVPRQRHVGVEEYDAPSPHEPRPDQGAVSDPQYDRSDGDRPADHDFGDVSPPDALQNLRSRIQLPTRGTLRCEPRSTTWLKTGMM